MKKFTILFFFATIFVACEKKDKVQEQIDQIPLELKVERFDKLFYETNPSELSDLKQNIHSYFRLGTKIRYGRTK